MDLSEASADCEGWNAHRPQLWDHSCHERGAGPLPVIPDQKRYSRRRGRAAQLYTDGRRCRPFHRRDRTRKKKNITIRNMEEAT